MPSVDVAMGISLDKFTFVLIQKVLAVPDKLTIREGMDCFSVDLHTFKNVEIVFMMMVGS